MGVGWPSPPTLKEKARKPRGKGDGDAAAAPAPAEGEAAGGGKASGAAQAALDAMEQLVNTLAHGKEEMEWERDEILSKVSIYWVFEAKENCDPKTPGIHHGSNCQEMEVAPTQVPATAQRKNDAPKRKAVEAEPGFEDGEVTGGVHLWAGLYFFGGFKMRDA